MSSVSVPDEVEGDHIGSSAKKWPRVRLADVAVINPRRPTALHRDDDEPTTFIPMEAVDARAGAITSAVLRPYRDVKKGYTYFEEGDVIFAKITPCMQNGKHAVCEGLRDGLGFGSTEFHVLRPGGRLLRQWLHYFLRQPDVLDDAKRHFTGAVGQQRLPEAYLRDLELPLPTIPEQERVAGELRLKLASVDTARRAAQERLDVAQALSLAYLQEAFFELRMKQWPSHRIHDFAKTCSGATPPRGVREYFGGDIPWVKTGELRDGVVGGESKVEEYVTPRALRECSLPMLPAGTLLIAMYGQGKTRGRTGLLASEATTNQACFAILPNPDRFAPQYLQLWFRANYQRLREMTDARGGNQPNLNGVLLRQLDVPLPPLPVQREIAATLSQKLEVAECFTTYAREEIAVIEAMPAAILRQAFENN